MKKLLGLVITAIIMNSVVAQTTTINESFETWPAPDWNTYMYEGGGWHHSPPWGGDLGYGGGNCALHKIWNNAVDDWLVTPQIDVISSDYELVFYEKLDDLQYYTYAGIHISTASGNPADGNFVEIAESLQVDDQWVEHIVDLSSYNGESIYIAFVFQGPTENWSKWLVDEVEIRPINLIDGALTEIVNPNGIDPVPPGVENVIVKLHNYGTDAINNADFEWSVNGVNQTTYVASGLNLAPGNDLNITVGQYDFATQGDYLISVNLVLAGDINPTNDVIESIYYVTDPKDAALMDINPEGYLAVTGNEDVTATIMNVGNYTIDDLVVEWEVNGVAQTYHEASSLGLDPGEDITLTIGQYNFQNGLVEINATVVVSGDEDLSNNSNVSYVTVNMFWESFEAGNSLPEMWTSTYGFFEDWDNPSPPHGEFYYNSMSDDNYFGVVYDTLYTPMLDIEDGDQITLWVYRGTAFFNSSDLIWKDGTTGEVHVIAEILSDANVWVEVTMDISDAAGANYIGFAQYSASYGDRKMDLISSDASVYQFDHDLGVRNLTFNYLAKQNQQHTFSVYLRNYGLNTVTGGSYTVKLMTESGEQLTSASGVTLQNWEEAVIDINHTFSELENMDVYAVIDYSGDDNELNNTSYAYSLSVIPADAEAVDVGFPEGQNLNIPFDSGGDTWTNGTSDISQNLYYTEEFEDHGFINGITLYYTELMTVGQELPLQVWIKLTDMDDLSGGWLSTDNMQMVFDDTISVYPGNGMQQVYIPFDDPIIYNGTKNLAIQYYQYDPEWPFTVCRFFATNNDNGPIRSISLLNAYEIDPYDPPDYWNNFEDNVYTTFHMQPYEDEGVISGVVYNGETSDPIQGARVEAEGTGQVVYTNTNGAYAFNMLPFAEYNITVTTPGYYDMTQTVNLNAPEVTLDFYLEPLPLVSFSGEVYGSDAPSVPLEGVLVTLDGDATYTAYTDENGEFLIEDVHGEAEYSLSFQLYGYHDFLTSVDIPDSDMDYGPVILDEDFISAYNVFALPQENQAMIEWHNPITSQKIMLQNDTDDNWFSYTNEPYEDVWLGNLFESDESITVISAEVVWDIWENAHDYVTIDILDVQGNVLVSSQPFQTYNDSTMSVDIPNISIEGDFYAMVHWQDNPQSTDPLAIDFSPGIQNTAYIKYPGQDPVLLSDFLGSDNGSFMLRVNTLQESTGRESREVLSYNIYKGLAENIDEADQWDALNTEPVEGLTFIDETWSDADPQLYTYAIEAIYVEDDAEFTFSNFISGTVGVGEEEIDDINIYPNPASSTLNLSGVQGTTITVYNLVGEVIFEEDVTAPTTRIDVSYFENGNYIVRILRQHEQIVKKLVIAK